MCRRLSYFGKESGMKQGIVTLSLSPNMNME